MAYKDFTIERLGTEFGIKNKRAKLFEHIKACEPSSWLVENPNVWPWRLSIRSEKARSELLITLVLLEVKNKANHFLTIHSGERLNADPEKGLVGECDCHF